MRLLLDTHVVLWWLMADPALSDEARELIRDTPEVYVSVASTWELAIKKATGKLGGPGDLLDRVAGAGFSHLPIDFYHAIAAGQLPMIHRDPFDRMLVAQAQCEAMTLATHDPEIQKYDVELLII